MWWITGVPIWHECFLLYSIPLWRCFGSCVHKVFPHLSHSKTCQNRVCRTSASHWGWPCFWSTYLTSWSNGVPMRFDTILLNWSTLTVRSKRSPCSYTKQGLNSLSRSEKRTRRTECRDLDNTWAAFAGASFGMFGSDWSPLHSHSDIICPMFLNVFLCYSCCRRTEDRVNLTNSSPLHR